jgi:hypothetical protein
VKTGGDTFTRNFVSNAGRRGDCYGIKVRDGAEQFAPIGEAWLWPGASAAGCRSKFEAVIGRDGGNVLVTGDLAKTNDRNSQRPHQRVTPST